jgi:3-deoxy-manno-octulosonate cytidylyltransferase (CMP-KDO synthetase)
MNNQQNKILCCIPARYHSSRLPGKPLLKINNKTIINLVYEKANQIKVDNIIVLTDDDRIYNEVLSFGGNCAIITEECLNGTERIIKYLNSINNNEYNIIVNLQGDEPFIKPDIVNDCISNFLEKKPSCSTICFKTTNKEEILSKSRGKVVTDNNNNIMYCSRNIIPSNKQNTIIENYEYKIHVGIFVYDKKYLLDYFCKENTENQLLEDIEWLKIIEQGFTINTILSDEMERGIDTIEDYNYLKNNYEKNKIINI